MSPSIRDIADRAGVNASTVSRVINGSQRYRISEETAQRVWQAVHELNYQVDHTARQIIRRRWHGDKLRGGIYRIGVIYMGLQDQLSSAFHQDILFGIQAGILEKQMVLAGMFDSAQLRDDRLLFHATDPTEVDGVLLLTNHTYDALPRIRERIRANVLLATDGPEDQDCVTFDYIDSIGMMVRHLAALGHTRIGYLGRSEVHERTTLPSRDRTLGFKRAMCELGLDIPPAYMIDTTTARRSAFADQIEQFLALDPRPTALACISDRACIEMLRRLVEAGLRVPGDVALGGFQDIDAAGYMIPRLTTIHTPRHDLGRRAVQMLIDRIENPDAPRMRELIPTNMVIRESCGSRLACSSSD